VFQSASGFRPPDDSCPGFTPPGGKLPRPLPAGKVQFRIFLIYFPTFLLKTAEYSI
jgi:hypothetical protein